MSAGLQFLLAVLLVLAIVMIALQVRASLMKQANLIVKMQQNESFTTPNHAWNTAASYTNQPNYLLTTAQNSRYRTEKPFFLNSTNQTRDVIPMNGLATNKQQVMLADANSRTGYRNSVAFPPQATNPPVTYEDRLQYDDTSAAVKQKPSVDNDEEGLEFSVNNRVNASSSRQLTPNESTAEKVLEGYGKKGWKRVGKI